MSVDATLALPSRLDPRNISLWTAELVDNRAESVRETFRRKGARGPVVTWNPPPQALVLQQLEFLRRYWGELAGDRRIPTGSEVDALAMRPALGYVILLDVIDGGSDFRYRVFGSIIASVSGFDMSGKRVSEHRASAYIVEFALACYRAALARGEPLLTEHGPPATLNTVAWHRLVLPLAGADGNIARFLIGNVPVARDGRPIALRL